MRIIAVPVVLALTLGLAACAPDPAPAETVAEETPVATPTPEPTRPLVTQIVISPDGLGTLRVGQTLPDTDDPDTALAVLDPEHCLAPGAAEDDEPTEPGWVAHPSLASPEPTYLNPGSGVPFTLGVDGSTLTRIDIQGSGPATAEGIQVGSPRADVLAAYPDAEEVSSSPISEVYRLPGASSQLLIEVAVEGDDWDGYWSSGADRVLIMRIIPLDEEPRPVAGGDDVVTGCSYSGA